MKEIIIIVLFLMLNSKFAQAESKYTGNKFRDPFESYLIQFNQEKITPSQKFEKLRVKGVIWGSESPLAIINDKVYKVGDSILGAKIVEINKRGVLLDYKGKVYILKPK